MPLPARLAPRASRLHLAPRASRLVPRTLRRCVLVVVVLVLVLDVRALVSSFVMNLVSTHLPSSPTHSHARRFPTVPNAPPPPTNRCAVGAIEWRCKRGCTHANAADHATTATAPVQGKTTTQTPTSTPPATPPTTHAAPPRSGGHHHAPPTNLYFDERMGELWAGAPPAARAQTREGARAGR